MSTSMSEVADEEWAQRVQGLDEDERARRLQAVNVLLAHPDDLSTPLESELYVLRSQLEGRDG